MEKTIVVTINGGVANVYTNIPDARILIFDFDDLHAGGECPYEFNSEECSLTPEYLAKLQEDCKQEKESMKEFIEENS